MPQRKRVQPVSSPTTKRDDEMTNHLAQFVTTKEAAEMLGVAQDHIRKLLGTSKMEGKKLGHDWIVYAPSLAKYLVNKSKRGRPTSGTPTIQVE